MYYASAQGVDERVINVPYCSFSVALRPQIPHGHTVRSGEPRTSTSIFTQLLRSDSCSDSRSVMLYVHRDRTDY